MSTKQAFNEKLQGSVATYLMCGGVINQIKKGFLLSLRVKISFKSVNIWQSYKQERDCLVHFLRLLAVRWPGAQSARWLNVSGATYRFRVVAVVASGSSRQSPSSEKVYMSSAVVERKTAVLLPAPVISDARALSGTEIFIGWQVWC